MSTSASAAVTARIPFLPDNAPFTPDQRAWLNGFLAGIFSEAQTAAMSGAPLPRSRGLKVSVLFGSESGNCEALAKKLAKAVQQKGFEAKALGLDKVSPQELTNEECVLIVTSTFGEGDPPENAKAFHAQLHDAPQPRLDHLSYAVLGLGDRNYEHFCKCAVDLDVRMAELGARRLYERVECDVDYQSDFDRWQTGVVGVLAAMQERTATRAPAAGQEPAREVASLPPSPTPARTLQGCAATSGLSSVVPRGGESTRSVALMTPPEITAHGQAARVTPLTVSRSHPFPARLVVKRRLTAETSEKETRHFEISLEGSGISYEAGDALGVFPTNCPALVDELLHVLNRDGEEAVPTPDGGEAPLRTALLRHYEITRVPALLLETLAARSSDRTLAAMMLPDAKDALSKYLWGREIVDVLRDFASVTFSPAEFVGHLRKLQPRLYSISSSPKAHCGEVHLTVATVRYESLGRTRKGVCSTFLAERANGAVPVFVQPSPGFRLPKDDTTPVIMIGPGTGIAPFRAFLHERRATGATGRNWLFFGEQRSATDFLYKDELEPMHADGLLTVLSTAFSRDQTTKVYVQHRMRERGGEFWSWLEEGAHLYVCGDANRMAKDVDAELHSIIRQHGGLNEDAAAEYVQKLKSAKRYQRDVY